MALSLSKVPKAKMSINFALGALFLLALTLKLVSQGELNRATNVIQVLSLYFPLLPSEALNPGAVRNVGDQVLAEHLIGFHSQPSFRSGLLPIFSEVYADRNARRILVKQLHPVRLSSGVEISLAEQCRYLEETFSGSLHVPTFKSVKSVHCDDTHRTIEFIMNYVPINFEGLFSTPDLGIFNRSDYPKGLQELPETTGPFKLLTSDRVKTRLAPNAFYPSELRANSLPADLYWSRTHELEFISKLDPQTQHAIYFFGSMIDGAALDILRKKSYVIEQYPSEWLLYLGFNRDTDLTTRKYIGSLIDQVRLDLNSKVSLGQPAFSLSPQDRAFGLNFQTYSEQVKANPQKPERKLRIAVLKRIAASPAVSFLADSLKNLGGDQIDVVFLNDEERLKMDSPEFDGHIRQLGISPGDPITHFSYILNSSELVAKHISEQDLESLSQAVTLEQFNSLAIAFEQKIARERLLIPIAHFPGVVATAPFLERDEKLAWSWGMQAWTYRIR